MNFELNERLFARISKLFDVEAFANLQVMIAGCGSGGSQVALQLALSGVKNFILIDNEELETENVIRHVCGLRHIGQKKTDAVGKAIRERNPYANIQKFNEDLLHWNELETHVKKVDIVVLATDNDPTRYRINELCVLNGIFFVVGRVFTRGIGGETFAYRPGEGGCLACLERVLERTQFREGVREIDLVPDQIREEMYGLAVSEIKDSPGLAVDIAFITAFHTRFVLDALASNASNRPAFLLPIEENYIVWGNRAVPPFTKNFELQRITLRPQEDCLVCGGFNEI